MLRLLIRFLTVALLIWLLLTLKPVSRVFDWYFYFTYWSFLISVIAQVWVFKLTAQGGVFYFVRRFFYSLAERYAGKDSCNFALRYERFEYFLKPFLTCEHCVSGQLSLWFFIFFLKVKFLYLVPFICLTIFITQATNTIWNNTNQ